MKFDEWLDTLRSEQDISGLGGDLDKVKLWLQASYDTASSDARVDAFTRNIEMWRDWIRGENHAQVARKHGVPYHTANPTLNKMTRAIVRHAIGPPRSILLTCTQAELPPTVLWIERALKGIWVVTDSQSGEWSNPKHRYKEAHFYFDEYPKGRYIGVW